MSLRNASVSYRKVVHTPSHARPAAHVDHAPRPRDRPGGARGARLHRARRRRARPGALRPRAGDRAGPRRAHHVLVLVPGTSAGAAYFRPVAARPGQAASRLAGVGGRPAREPARGPLRRSTGRWPGRRARELFDYYLGWIANPAIGPALRPVADVASPSPGAGGCAWRWRPAPRDRAPRGAAAATSCSAATRSAAGSPPPTRRGTSAAARARATSPGWCSSTAAAAAAGDAARRGAAAARRSRRHGRRSSTSAGLGLPWSAGVFNAVGSTLARREPDAPAVLEDWPLLPADLKPPVPATNARRLGYALDTETSPESLALVRAHIGGLAAVRRPARLDRTASSATVGARRASVLAGSPASTAPPGTTRAA